MAEDEKLKDHIRRTVGVSALRKIRHVVNEYEEQDAANRRFSRRVIVSSLAVLIGVTALLALLPEREQPRAFSEQISKPLPGARRLDVGSGRIADPDVNRYVADWREKAQHSVKARIAGAPGNYRGPAMLTVAIRADGALERIQVEESTGEPELDKFVAGIIKQSAPFPQFPASMKDKMDVLYVTSTFNIREP